MIYNSSKMTRRLLLCLCLASMVFVSAQSSDMPPPFPYDTIHRFGFMSSKELKSKVLSAEGVESGLYKKYVDWRNKVNAWDAWLKNRRDNEFKDAEIISRSTSSNVTIIHYRKKLSSTKTCSVIVTYVNGKEDGRTTDCF